MVMDWFTHLVRQNDVEGTNASDRQRIFSLPVDFVSARFTPSMLRDTSRFYTIPLSSMVRFLCAMITEHECVESRKAEVGG